MPSFTEAISAYFNIDNELAEYLEKSSRYCRPFMERIEQKAQINQVKVLKAFQENQVMDFHLNGSTGYGYGDTGRDTLEAVYASVFGTERALVRAQIVSGTHAIAIGLLGNLQRGDELVVATGKPYDTLLKVIGTKGEYGSLLHQGIIYREVPLLENGEIDQETLFDLISDKTKMLYFQRSRGYEWRPSFTVDSLKSVIEKAKKLYPGLICMVDNCYGELVEVQEPTNAGADLVAGSLIKNPGGGLALAGGYLAGKTHLIERAATRLSAPGIGLEVGSSLSFNRWAYQGLFMASLIVGEALKGSVLAAEFFRQLGFAVSPLPEEERTDIIQAIRLDSKERMLAFCRGLQKACPIDSLAKPEPALLPGYAHEVIMAGGTFIQGSSIELSADGPMRPPYSIYLQGGLALGHIKTGLLLAANELIKRTG